MRRKSPVRVQAWIDSLPPAKTVPNNNLRSDFGPYSSASSAKNVVRGFLMRDASIQSDDASNCSSVESVLELRKPDPEAVLLGLGFGPPKATDYLTRIPQRFLQPSKVNGIDIGKFLKEQEELRSLEHQLNHPHLTCSQTHSLPVSPNRNCDRQLTQEKKNSF